MTASANPTRRRVIALALVSAAFLVPALWGFGSKFVEFVALYRRDTQGAFTIIPIVNYLLASAGFLLLFLWAALHGMFRDIEQPKYTMLENERRIDQHPADVSLERERTPHP